MNRTLSTSKQNTFLFQLLNYFDNPQGLKWKLFCFFIVFTNLVYGQINDNSPGINKTFPVPANVTHVNAAAWGGGGGGGGSNSNNNGGNGGGGGGAASSSQIGVSAGNIFTFTVGTAGAAGGSGGGTGGNGGNGGNGGTSTITSPSPITSLTGNGGTGGLGNAAGLNTPTNSGGGAATGGTNSAGANGTVGAGSGGNGGNSGTAFGFLGIGGAGSANSAGLPGLSRGAGGGGGERSCPFFCTNYGGGAGAPGFVMIDFISVSAITPNPVCIGSTITITGTNFTVGSTTVTVNGTACSNVTVVDANKITAVIEAGTTSGRVDVVNDGKRNNGIIISVNPAPVTPGNPTSNSPQCTPPGVTLTRTGTPPAGETWYWQTAAGNTDMTNSGATYNVAASGTYYIRARNNSTGCWSVGAGNLAVSVSTVISAIATNPVPANNATGICFQGLNSVNSINWSAVAGATSYDVYFGAGSVPGIITANVTTNSFSTGILAGNTTYFWRIVPKNACGITTGTQIVWNFRTSGAPCSFNPPCTPSTGNPSKTYINDVRFLGTLNDVDNLNSGFLSGNGYQNFTSKANKAKQAAGEGINVFVKSNERNASWKVWVDWNQDGTFDNTVGNPEIVFISGGIQAISTTFGIIIPATKLPGDYVVRIRNYRSCEVNDNFCGGSSYGPCTAFTGIDNGEAEDYVITVVSNCASNLDTVTNAIYCGPGALTLSGKGTAGTKTLRWYDSVTGGNLLAETPVDGTRNASFTTPNISSTTTYYVTAFNGTCESIFRRPVVARIRPIPNISFDLPLASANFCGDDNTLKLTSAGEQEQIILLEENFDSGLGLLTRTTGTDADFTPTTDTSILFPFSGRDNSTVSQTGWQNQSSTFPPVGSIWKPAISSGFGGNKFAFATSDYSNTRVHTILTSTASFDTSGFTNLNLTFSAYYSYYGDTSSLAGGTVEGLFVEVSTNGGSTWTTVQPYFASLGIGTAFQNMTVPLNAYLGIANLKVRFRYLAYWGDGVAIDNIKLYGDKPLSTSFVWTASDIGIYQSNCTTPYVNGTPTSSVCIKPNDTQLQTIASWNISAVATLSNGCTSIGVINVQNNNKVWDHATTNWSGTYWQPTSGVPDIGKCVLVKKPVNINTGNHFEAKNVKVASGGTLTINENSSLKIQDYLNNTQPATSVLLESGGNLIQVNEGININTGAITAKKTFAITTPRKQYNYFISPLEDQNLKTIYPGIDFALYYNESTNYLPSSSGAYIKGRGLAVKEPNTTGVPLASATVTGTFTGKPTNGAFAFPMINSAPTGTGKATRGYNLVGNPYPSNIDLNKLYAINSGDIGNIDATFYFWDSTVNDIYVQEGSNYGGQSYGLYNASSGLKTPATGDIKKISAMMPTQFVKVGKGFLARSKTASSNLLFNNTIRTNTAAPVLSRGAAPEEGDSYWLTLVSPADIASTIAVGYREDGNNALSNGDSPSLMGSDAIFTCLGEEKLAIDGRGTFNPKDVVKLGTAHFAAGKQRILLLSKKGIFAREQNIYLKDNRTGAITNLSAGAYAFEADQGENTGRFEIIYQPETVLLTDDKVKSNIEVYRDNNHFIIRSAKNIIMVEVYDLSGKLLTVLKDNKRQVILNASFLTKGIYVLRIKTSDGAITNRKISS